MSHSLITDFQRFSLFAVDLVGDSRDFTNKHLLLVGLVAVPKNRPQHHPVLSTGAIDARLLIAFLQQFNDATLQFGITHDRRTKYLRHCTDFRSKSGDSKFRIRYPVVTIEAIYRESVLEILYDIICRKRVKRSPRIPANVNVNAVGR